MFSHSIFAEKLDLATCYKKATEASPLYKQKMMYESINMLENQNLTSNYYPQFNIDGQATYQSDVFKLPLNLPPTLPFTLDIPTIPQGQYRVNLNINETIWDGGLTSYSKDKANYDNLSNKQSVEVNLFKIKDIINQLFFTDFILTKNIHVLQSLKTTLDSNFKQMESLISNGVALKSSRDGIQIEIFKTNQKIEELKRDKIAARNMLGKWIGSDVTLETELTIPEINNYQVSKYNRPEYELFDLKSKQTETGENLLSAQLMPKFAAFFQAGYGAPNQLNFFKTKGSWYYLAGLKMLWTPFDWSTSQKKREELELSRQIIDSEKGNFDLSLHISTIKDESDIKKFDETIRQDDAIINLQLEVVREKLSKLTNGTITSTEYITELNNLTQYQINKELHIIQQLNAKVNLLTKTGNL